MHLTQHRLEIAALGEVSPVRAVARVEQIRLPKCRAAPDRGRFLSDHQMNWCLHLVLVVSAFDFLLDATDAEHREVQANEERRLVRVPEPRKSRGAFTLVRITDGHGLGTVSPSVRLIKDDAAA